MEYHHFNPQWSERHHHDPEGMVALCATHHGKADAWTVEQCLELKENPHTTDVSGRFEWMRREVVAIVGGNYYHETPQMVIYRDKPIVWFERDERGYLLLSISMLTCSGEPRTELVANDWEIQGNPLDVDSPPNGSYLRVKYANGDDVQVRFKEWASPEELGREHPRILVLGDEINFPLVTAEVQMVVAGSNIRFDAKRSHICGGFYSGNVVSRCGAGLVLQ